MTTKADTSVKWFHSGMADAPVLSGQAGKLIELLDACLINGFSTRTPDSIVVAGGVATVSIGAGNPYEQHAVVEISGASNAALNAEWRIDTASASSFTFLCPGVLDGTVAGSVVKRAGAGWGKQFSGANIAAYQSVDPASTQLYLRVDDNDARFSRVRGYENMVDETASNSNGPFPTLAQLAETNCTWAKSTVADASSREWLLIGDGRFFYFMPKITPTTYFGLCYFGDIVSAYQNDNYHCVIRGWSTSAPSSVAGADAYLNYQSASSGTYLARSYTNSGSALSASLRALIPSTSSGNSSSFPYFTGGPLFLAKDVVVSEGMYSYSPYRGLLPGVLGCAQNLPLSHLDFVENSLTGKKTIVLVATGNSTAEGRTGFEVVEAWR